MKHKILMVCLISMLGFNAQAELSVGALLLPRLQCAALVIGNANYSPTVDKTASLTRNLLAQVTSIGDIKGVEADANLLAGALAVRGFKVTKLNNLTAKELEDAVSSFSKSEASILWFAYSGMGNTPEEGEVLLVGVDGKPTQPLTALLKAFSGSPTDVRIVTLDSQVNNGMTPVPAGMVVQWAAQPGEVVWINQASSFYSTALAKELLDNDLPLNAVLKRTQAAMMASSPSSVRAGSGSLADSMMRYVVGKTAPVSQIPMWVNRVPGDVWNALPECGQPTQYPYPPAPR